MATNCKPCAYSNYTQMDAFQKNKMFVNQFSSPALGLRYVNKNNCKKTKKNWQKYGNLNCQHPPYHVAF